MAVYRVACESVERVRQGGNPVLVEGKPYRLFSKTKRRVANSAAWLSERDPLTHMERYLKAKGLFTLSWKRPGGARVFAETGQRPQGGKEAVRKGGGKSA